jgi:uncharacterized protein
VRADEPAEIVVSGLSITAVKGTRLQQVDRIELDRIGARGNRRLFVVDEHGRMVNAKHLGALQTVVARLEDGDPERLELTFPDRRVIDGPLELGEPITAGFFSRTVHARAVEGPWPAALSAHLGQPVRLASTDTAVDRGAHGAASLISQASLERLAREAGARGVDGRRFRMLIEVDGVAAHAEDAWVGHSVRLGGAVVEWGGHVGRCLITSRHPDTGEIDVPTLELLAGYRQGLDSTEPLPFGIYGRVVQPGPVRVGDRVALVD